MLLGLAGGCSRSPAPVVAVTTTPAFLEPRQNSLPLENMPGAPSQTLTVGPLPRRPALLPSPSPSPTQARVAAARPPRIPSPRSVTHYPRARPKVVPTPEEPVEVALQAPSPAPPREPGRGEVDLGAEFGSAQILSTGQPRLVYLLLEAKASEENLETFPINLALVIDTSGSMDVQKKLDYAILAVHQALERLRPIDNCALVVFGTSARTVLHTPARPGLAILDKLIRDTPVGDATYLVTGLQAALSEVRANLSAERLNHVLILTDGMTEDDQQCLEICRTASQQGISLSAVGLGSTFDADLLARLSAVANGRYYSLDSPAQIPEIFNQELKGVRNVVMRNNRLVLSLARGVSIRHAYQIKPGIRDLGEPLPSNGEVTVPMGDLRQGETLSVLFELSLASRPAGRHQVATARVEHDEVQGVSSHPIEVVFTRNRAQAAILSPKVAEVVDSVTRWTHRHRR